MKSKDLNQQLVYQVSFIVLFFVIFFAWSLFQDKLVSSGPETSNGSLIKNKVKNGQKNNNINNLYAETVAKVLPKDGFETRLVLGDIVPKLVSYGIIDAEKFRKLYGERGLIDDKLSILTKNSETVLKIDAGNAGLLLNIFWPIGLANKTVFNEKSPIKGESLFRFASTGGWTLGKEDNGGKYFNKYNLIKLTPQQETIALDVAKNTYRPCCGNSTFFQDCNHGSALLGVIELGASQGMSKEELYKLAMDFNSFWFPDTYIKTALYFKIDKKIDWKDVDPKEIMSYNYSSGPGWSKNIAGPFQEILKKNSDIFPKASSGGSCGV